MLYALRNAFAHEYALANEGKKGLQDDPLRHRFQLAESEDRLLVAYPEKSWNGVYGAESEGGPTEVNLSELQVLVERVIARIERAVLAGSLRLVVGVSPQMVLARWGFRVRNDLPRRPTSPAF
ncbi:MAG: hypothetical protein QOJ67_210 [Acidimicrobiaceae bacterium]